MPQHTDFDSDTDSVSDSRRKQCETKAHSITHTEMGTVST